MVHVSYAQNSLLCNLFLEQGKLGGRVGRLGGRVGRLGGAEGVGGGGRDKRLGTLPYLKVFTPATVVFVKSRRTNSAWARCACWIRTHKAHILVVSGVIEEDVVI